MTVDTRSDADVKVDVSTELFFDPQVTESEIRANVTKGRVTLSGVVDTYATKWAAECAAYRVKGVHSVHDLITVDPNLLEMPSDADLTISVRTALDWDASIPHKVRCTLTNAHCRHYRKCSSTEIGTISSAENVLLSSLNVPK